MPLGCSEHAVQQPHPRCDVQLHRGLHLQEERPHGYEQLPGDQSHARSSQDHLLGRRGETERRLRGEGHAYRRTSRLPTIQAVRRSGSGAVRDRLALEGQVLIPCGSQIVSGEEDELELRDQEAGKASEHETSEAPEQGGRILCGRGKRFRRGGRSGLR